MNDLAMDAAVRMLKETQDKLDAALERERGLREVVEFYAEVREYNAPGGGGTAPILSDQGMRARAALAATGKENRRD